MCSTESAEIRSAASVALPVTRRKLAGQSPGEATRGTLQRVCIQHVAEQQFLKVKPQWHGGELHSQPSTALGSLW